MSTTATPAPRLLTVDEAAAYCRISRATVYRRIRRGELPAVRVGNESGVYRIPEDELRAWLFGPEPEHPETLLDVDEVARRLDVPVSWVRAQKFTQGLGRKVDPLTCELVGVRVRELENWERAARAAYPKPRAVGG